jgi:hypothetical protein
MQLFITPKKARKIGEAYLSHMRKEGLGQVVSSMEVRPHVHLNRDGSADHCYRVATFNRFGTFAGWL